MPDPYMMLSGPEIVSEEQQLELQALARATLAAFGSAGLPAVVVPNGESVPGVEIEMHRHTYDSGVFAEWAVGTDMRAAANSALIQGRFTDPAIKLAGTVADVMSVAMLNVLLASGFSARIADDEIGIFTVEVLAGP